MTERHMKHTNENLGGALLIGLAVLLVTHWWWPGILFVVGIALLVRTISEGRSWIDERPGLILIGIGSVFVLFDLLRFVLGFWPLLLIAVGVYLLYNSRHHIGYEDKSKNDFV